MSCHVDRRVSQDQLGKQLERCSAGMQAKPPSALGLLAASAAPTHCIPMARQLLTAPLCCRSVGVQGDQRTHSHVVALRAVTSADGMTADWYQFEPAFLGAVSTRICNTVKSVNRVVYDITSKPPGTIEWE